jgi:hypothetical protein
MKTVMALGLAVVVLAPTAVAGKQYVSKLTIEQRVTLLEKRLKENNRRDRIVQNVLYLKGSGVLPLTVETRMMAAQTQARLADLEGCIQYRSVTLPGQSGPDRVAVIHPVCLSFQTAK